MDEDRELRLIVIALLRAVSHLRAAVAAVAATDSEAQERLRAADAAIDDAIGRFEQALVHERA